MAFVIKNSSRYVGEVKVDGNWISLSPGQSTTSSEKPLSLSPNLRVFSINDLDSQKALTPKGNRKSKDDSNEVVPQSSTL